MIEPVFADTKFNRRIDRFQRRGRSACRSEFSNYFKVPHFTVQAQPFDAEELLREKHPGFVAASRKLQQCGFDSNGRYWAHVHKPEEWLYRDDVPQTLAGFVDADITNIVESGLFDEDVAAGVSPRRVSYAGGRVRIRWSRFRRTTAHYRFARFAQASASA
jgi:hypothetical protein